MATPAIRMLRRLEGLFSVYKPSGVHWKLVRDTIETNVVNGEEDGLAKPFRDSRTTFTFLRLASVSATLSVAPFL